MKTPFNSLLWRIIWLHMLAVAVLAVVLPMAVRLLLNSTASSFEHQTMRRHEAEIAAYLYRTPTGWQLNLPPMLKAEYVQASSGFAFAIVDAHDRVLFSSLPSRGALFPNKSSREHPDFYQRAHGPAVYYGGSFPEARGADIAWVQVAQDLEHPDVVVDDIVSAFLQKIAWLILPILLLLALTDFIIVRRALMPVTRASDMARAIGPSSLQIRLPTDRIPEEIVPLAHAVNQALDRLEHGFRVQREFTADAAHELRTPLSIQRARLASIRDVELRRALEADSDRMARIISQLLDVAELDSFVPDPAQITDLQELGAEMVEYMAPMALARGRRLALTGASRPVWVQGESEVLFRAIRNLVENALAHTPAGATVEVKVEAQGVLRVLDRGPGVPASDRELVFQRFWRRDRSKSGGAGLGLSIVKKIIEAHGGEISVQSRSGGGAAFVIRLNRAYVADTAGRRAPGKVAASETEDV
jgi:signal transduction histidine kinase